MRENYPRPEGLAPKIAPCGPDTVPERSEVGAGGAASDRVPRLVGASPPAPAPTLRGTVSRAVVVGLAHRVYGLTASVLPDAILGANAAIK